MPTAVLMLMKPNVLGEDPVVNEWEEPHGLHIQMKCPSNHYGIKVLCED